MFALPNELAKIEKQSLTYFLLICLAIKNLPDQWDQLRKRPFLGFILLQSFSKLSIILTRQYFFDLRLKTLIPAQYMPSRLALIRSL